jgi:hypothetical protein
MKDGVREEGKQRRKARGAHKERREGRRKGKATRGDALRVSKKQEEDETDKKGEEYDAGDKWVSEEQVDGLEVRKGEKKTRSIRSEENAITTSTRSSKARPG